MDHRIQELYGISIPIIQAGMAGGPAGAELAAAVSEAGGLGTIGAGYSEPAGIVELIQVVQQQTSKPFAVNLFLPEEKVPFSEESYTTMINKLNQLRRRMGLRENTILSLPEFTFEDQVYAALNAGCKHFSFTFGAPSPSIMNELRKQGATVMATATSLNEAVLLEKAGVDAIAAQGSEAGGHRGTFIGYPLTELTGMAELVSHITSRVSIPVAAAGGIMDGRGVADAMAQGAAGVILGTAYLTAEESGASAVHKQMLLKGDAPTKLTKSFSGKYARGIQTSLMDELDEMSDILPYPVQHYLTVDIRKTGALQHQPEMTSMWAGQGYSLCQPVLAGELTRNLWLEAVRIAGCC
ncbi:NAD(P)H-dependent flavin oxidoreductase [Fictibacillus iocasae]|uniref:Probable nitronate monooxygenase n=1 Tax=Fictibacillus iocasae TaxID=2715437 RepID=A0ABW2NS05_9BACL